MALSEKLSAHGYDHFCEQCKAAAVEARAIEAEVARLSEGVRLGHERCMGEIVRREQAEMEVARLREVNAVTRERALQSEEIALSVIDERDALRAQMARARAIAASQQRGYMDFERIVAVLDGDAARMRELGMEEP